MMVSCGGLPSLRVHLLAGVLLVACGTVLARKHPPKQPPPTASTHCGDVEGVWQEGAAVFKGIPYGKPPTGEARWRPTSMPEKDDGCWKGKLPANAFGQVCTQTNGGSMTGSEDCLFINIITYNLNNQSKTKSEAKHQQDQRAKANDGDGASRTLLPVAVWIHGGSEMWGSGGGSAGYTPTPVFARKTGVVAVSLNYRLNVFGFLALKVLDEGTGTGNYGFYDQILALKWVQRNIETFGGDRNKVTVFGQSAGGTSVTALISSPLAHGLFHAAVTMSGTSTVNATIEEADKDNQVFLTGTGCQTAACLRNTSAEQLLFTIPFNVYPFWGGGDAWDLPTNSVIVGKILVVDGVLMPEPSLDVIAKGQGNDVPIVIGSAGQEADIAPPVDVRDYTWDQYDAYVKKHMDTFNGPKAGPDVYSAVSRLYPHNMSMPATGGTCVTGTPEYLLTSMISDIRVICPIGLVARYYAKYFKSPVYNYAVVQCPSPSIQEGGARYSYHSWGAYALFNFTWTPDPGWSASSQDWGLVDTMQAWFSRFVAGTSPHPQWKTVESGTFNLLFEPEMTTSMYHQPQCDFLNEHGFIPYRWQN